MSEEEPTVDVGLLKILESQRDLLEVLHKMILNLNERVRLLESGK